MQEKNEHWLKIRLQHRQFYFSEQISNEEEEKNAELTHLNHEFTSRYSVAKGVVFVAIAANN